MHHYKNLQAISILERIHQVISSMIKTKDLSNVTFESVALWSKILTSIMYEVWCSYHGTLQATHGQLLFGRNMILDIDFQTNYKEMLLRKQ